ncbi:MAG: right-handed parallel beta-helix repeat-containing protein, partial [Planctomycetia bacterium]|nr:right-handed parallel beta-helix repeat-containing protein [Planctomycetia bacterium]
GAHSWSNPSEGVVSIFPRYNWSNNIISIKSYDAASRTITLASPMRFAARPLDRFCIYGLREELDVPGEWYYDTAAKKLLFMPPKGVTLDDLNREGVMLATSNTVLTLANVSNVTISGLTFICSINAGVALNDCNDCSLVKSVVHDTGFYGAPAVNVLHGERCTVYGCDIYNCGGSAISFNGGNDRYTLKESGHIFENNYIHHTGVHYKGGGSINIYGCGSKTAHNKMHDIPRTGIVLYGPKNIVEYNDIRHTNMESEDTGAIYSDGAAQWINNYGSIIRGNKLFDTIGFRVDHAINGKYVFHRFSWGLYLDNTCSGVDICDNIIKGASIGTIFLSNPRNNRVHNNILINGGDKQFVVSGWVTDVKKLSREKQPHTPQGDMLNYYPRMVAEYERAIKSPLWQKMPGMEVHPQDAFLDDGTVMTNNHVFSNIIYYPEQPESQYMVLNNLNLKHNEVDRNLVWNGGKVPLVTGATDYSRILANLTDFIPNVNFKSADEKSFPKDWQWFMKSRDDAKAEIVQPGTVRIHAAFNPERQYIKYARIRSKSFTLTEGKYYRLRVKSCCHEADGFAGAVIVSQDAGCWIPLGEIVMTAKTPKQFESAFKVPVPGEPKYDKRMKTFALHLFLTGKTGYADFENITFDEVQLATPWEAWQKKGADRHSICADPLFVDPGHDNYNLRPDSPAFKIGFKPIDFSKIGVYQDERRATWPIIEAEGVREHPEWLIIE